MKTITSLYPSEIYGQGKKKLYFFHANGFPPQAYTALFEGIFQFSEEPFQIIAYLARPLWQNISYYPKGLWDWWPLVDDVIGFLEYQEAKQAICFGHSMGALQMLMAAVKRPDLIGRIILLDPVIFSPCLSFLWWWIKFWDLAFYHPLLQATLRRKIFFESQESMFQNFRKKTIFQKFSDKVLWDYVQGVSKPLPGGQGVGLIYSPRWEAWIYAHDFHETWEKIRRLQQPFLAIRGSSSSVFSSYTLKKLLSRFDHGEGAEAPGGHLFPLENPIATSKLICHWI